MGVSTEGIFSVCRTHKAASSLMSAQWVVRFRFSAPLCDLWHMAKTWATFIQWDLIYLSLLSWRCARVMSEYRSPPVLSPSCLQVVGLGEEPREHKGVRFLGPPYTSDSHPPGPEDRLQLWPSLTQSTFPRKDAGQNFPDSLALLLGNRTYVISRR